MERLALIPSASIGIDQIGQSVRAWVEILVFLPFPDGFRVHALRTIGPRQSSMREWEVGIHFDAFSPLFDGLVVASREIISGRNLVIDRKREWVEIQCAFSFADRLVRAANCVEVER